jgi:acetoin:2,6-dichlorophenolindophenol oxidoreductase subunit beta
VPSYLARLNAALHEAFASDPRVILVGQDLLDPYGGAFKVTRGVQAKYPERVFTSPVSEAGIVGLAGGMALRGFKPIVEIMFGDFVMLASDQIVNHLTKYTAMYARGCEPLHVVIRTPMGGGRGYGPTHSQSLEKHLLGVPSLRVVAPSRFHDPGALLLQALAEPSPVLFVEDKRLYAAEIATDVQPPLSLKTHGHPWPTVVVSNAPEEATDVAVFAYGGGSLKAEELLRSLAEDEVRVTAVFPSCMSSLDVAHLASVARRAHAGIVVYEQGTAGFNWGSEVVAALAESMRGALPPVRRIAALPTVLPASRALEERVLPGTDVLRAAIVDLCARAMERRP